MTKVNLFLIGVNKAGTSWLYYLLDEHPDVFMADAKELYFFGESGRSAERPQNIQEYHAHFPTDSSHRYFGDATVMYYRSPAVADEIAEYNPDAKLLAIVRDPIRRLLSQFRYHKQLGLVSERASLEEALSDPDSRFVRDSHYEDTLPPFSDRFGPDQFKVISLEEGLQAPERLWEHLLDYLDLPAAPLPPLDERPENPTGSALFRAVYRSTVRPIRDQFPGVYSWMLQSTAVRKVKLLLLDLLGTESSSKDSLHPDLEESLKREFAPTYRYLQELGFDVYHRS